MESNRKGIKKNTLQVPSIKTRRTIRSSTQPTQNDFYCFKEIAAKIVDESSNAGMELRRIRTEIRMNEELQEIEKNCKTISQEMEMAKILNELQKEMIELNKIINSTHDKIKVKEDENQMLLEGIMKMKNLYHKNQEAHCSCIIY